MPFLPIDAAEYGYKQALVTLRADLPDIDVAKARFDIYVAAVQFEFGEVLAGPEEQAAPKFLLLVGLTRNKLSEDEQNNCFTKVTNVPYRHA